MLRGSSDATAEHLQALKEQYDDLTAVSAGETIPICVSKGGTFSSAVDGFEDVTPQQAAGMAHIGHPLLGDTLYGGKKDKEMDTQCLHARGLKFRHPATGETVEIWTQLPDWFRAVVGKLGPER